MSMDVDNRIVQMEFQNADFEKGIKESSKSLENFKKLLKFDNAGDGLEKLAKVSSALQLDKIADGIDQLTHRFSLFGTIAYNWAERVADKALYAAKNMTSMLSVGQIGAGFEKYNDYTTSVQTIISATGKSMDYVSKQMDKLMWFTDETSYSFTDMTNNIGKFTSMGIDLKTSVGAMQGIANWAALSGQNPAAASRAMYNMSQAVGMGSVKLMDWRSIENANMATKEFKETVIETAKELGVLDKNGKIVGSDATVTAQNFTENLSKGWFNKDVLLKTLGKYNSYTEEIYKIAQKEGISASEAMHKYSGEMGTLGERAFKAAQEAKTFNDAIDATKDAVSTSWLKTFEHIFGNYEEAKVLWTDLANNLWEIFAGGGEARNALLHDWKELGGRDGLVAGFNAIMETLVSLVSEFRDIWAEVFPITAKGLKDITDKVQSFGESIRDTFTVRTEEKTLQFADLEALEKAGISTNNLKKSVIEAAKELKVLDKNGKIAGTDIIVTTENFNETLKKGWINKSVLSKAINLVYQYGGSLEDINKIYDVVEERGLLVPALTKEIIPGLGKLNKELKEGTKGEDVTKLQKQLIGLGYDLGSSAADGIYGPKTKKAISDFQKASKIAVTGIYDEATHKALSKALGLEDTEVVVGIGESTAEEIEIVSDKLTMFREALNAGLSMAKLFGQSIGWLGQVFSKTVSIFSPLLNFVNALFTRTIGIVNAITDRSWRLFGSRGSATEFLRQFGHGIEPIRNLVERLSNSLTKFFGLDKDWSKSVKGMTLYEWFAVRFYDSIGKGFENLSKWMRNLSKWVVQFGKSVKKSKVIDKLRISFSKLGTALKNLFRPISELGSSVSKNFGSSFMDFVRSLPNRIIKLTISAGEFISKVVDKLTNWINDLPNFKKRISDFFGTLFGKTTKEANKALKGENGKGGILGFLKSIPSRVKEFVITIPDIFSRIKKAISNFLDKTGLSGFIENVKWCYRVIRNFVGILFEHLGGLFHDFIHMDTSDEDTFIGKLKKCFSVFDGFGKWLKRWFTIFMDKLGVTEKVEKVRKWLNSGTTNIVKTVKEIFSKLWESITGFFTADTSDDKSLGDKIKHRFSFFEDFGSWFRENILPKLKKPLEWVKEKLKKLFSKDGPLSFIGNIFGGNGGEDGENSGPFAGIAKKLQEIFGGIGGAFSKAFGFVKKVFKPALWIAAIYLVIRLLINVTGIVPKITKCIEKLKSKAQPLSESILDIAKAIAIIVGCIAVLALIPDGDRVTSAFDSVLIIFGAIAALMFATTKMSKEHIEAFSKIGDAIKGIGVGIAAIAAAIAIFGLLPNEVVEKGSGFMLIWLVLIGLFMFVMNKLNANTLEVKLDGMLQLAGAIAILGALAWLLGKVQDQGQLWRGIAAVAALAAILAGFLIAIKKFATNSEGKAVKPEGLIPIAVVIAVLGVVAWALGKMKLADLAKGVIAVILLLGTVAGLFAVIGHFGDKYDTKSLWAMFIGVALIIGVFGFFASRLGGVDPWTIAAFGGSIVAILAAVAGISFLLGKYNQNGEITKGAKALGLTLLALVGGVVVIVGALGGLDILTGGKVKEAAQRGVEILGIMFEIFDPENSNFAIVALVWIALSEIVGLINQKVGDPESKMGPMIEGALSLAASIGILVTMTTIIVGGLGELDILTEGEMEEAVTRGVPILNKMMEIYDPDASNFAVVAGVWVILSEIVGLVNEKIGDPNSKAGPMIEGALSLAGAISILVTMTTIIIGGLGWLDRLTEGGMQDAVDRGIPILNKMLEIYDPEKSDFDKVAAVWVILSEIVGVINEKIGDPTKKVGSMIKGAGSMATAIGTLVVMTTTIISGLGWLDKLSEGGMQDSVDRGIPILNKMLEIYDPEKSDFLLIATVWTGLSEVIGAINEAMHKAGMSRWAMIRGAGSIAAAIDILVASSTVIVGGLGTLEQLTQSEDYDFEQAVDDGAVILQKIASAFTGLDENFVKVFGLLMAIGAAVGITKTEGEVFLGTVTIGASIDALMALLTALVTGLGGIDAITNGKFSELIEGGGEILFKLGKSLSSFIGGIKAGFSDRSDEQVTKDMESFGNAFNSFFTAVDGFSENETFDADTDAALAQATKLHDFFNDLEGYDLVIGDSFNTYVSAAGQLSTDMKSFADALGSYRENISGLSDSKTLQDDTDTAIEQAKILKGFFDDIKTNTPDESFLSSFNDKVGDLMDDISEFATTMSEYSDKIKPIGDYDVVAVSNTAVDAAKAISQFLTDIETQNANIEKHKTGIAAWFSGDTTISTVLGYVEEFGKKVSTAVGYLAGIGSEDATTMEDLNMATNVVKTFMEVLNIFAQEDANGQNILDDGYWDISSRMGTWSGLFTDLAEGFNFFYKSIDDNTNVYLATEAVDSMAATLQAIADLAATGRSTDDVLLGLSGEEAGTKLTSFIQGVITNLDISSQEMSDNLEKFRSTGETFGQRFLIGIHAGLRDITWMEYLYRKVETIAENLLSALDRSLGFGNVGPESNKPRQRGINFLVGISNGLDDPTERDAVLIRVWNLGKDMLSELDRSLDENSPSEETRRRGRYFIEGLVNGINETGSAANAATENVANSMLNTASGTLSELSSVLASDIDEQPVIRPLVDLTDVKLAVGSISDMFASQTIGGYSASVVSRIGRNSEGRPVANQNGSADVVQAINEMNMRIDNLGIAIQNMQMVVDSGALVGHIAPAMDKRLGAIATMRGRMG